ncbi:MAG: hypothetical protein GF317_04950 [Candidatus Lokiarchaeota archaeon]|nr:hypothetical protein [Candidatus Lokiarchaeota archaeon]
MCKENDSNFVFAELKSLMQMRRIGNIKRYGLFAILHPQSVSSHVAHVVSLAYLICKNEKQIGEMHISEELLNKVLVAALYHDTEEIYSGDIPYTFKRDGLSNILKSKCKDKLEHYMINENGVCNVWESVYSGWLLAHYICGEVDDAADDKFLGDVVASADMLELCLFCYEEYRLGNKTILEVLYRGLKILRDYDFIFVKIVRNQILRLLFSSFGDDNKNALSIEKHLDKALYVVEQEKVL